MSKNVPKNIVWACFDWFFRRRKALPSAPWRLKKILENRKTFNFSKMSKTDTKSVQTSFEVIFSKFFFQCTLEGREVEKFQKMEKNSNFQNPENFPKMSNFFEAFFFQISYDQCTLEIKTCKNYRKNSKNLKFQKCPKTFLKVSKQVVELVLRWLSWKNMPSAPWRVETW